MQDSKIKATAAETEGQLSKETDDIEAKGSTKKVKTTPAKKPLTTKNTKGKKALKTVSTPSVSDVSDEDDITMPDLSSDDVPNGVAIDTSNVGKRQSGRARKVSYKEVDIDE